MSSWLVCCLVVCFFFVHVNLLNFIVTGLCWPLPSTTCLAGLGSLARGGPSALVAVGNWRIGSRLMIVSRDTCSSGSNLRSTSVSRGRNWHKKLIRSLIDCSLRRFVVVYFKFLLKENTNNSKSFAYFCAEQKDVSSNIYRQLVFKLPIEL